MSDLERYHDESRQPEVSGLPIDLANLLFLHTFKRRNRSIVTGRRNARFRSGHWGLVPAAAEVGYFQAAFNYNGNWDSWVAPNYEFVFHPVEPGATERLLDADSSVANYLQTSLDKIPSRGAKPYELARL